MAGAFFVQILRRGLQQWVFTGIISYQRYLAAVLSVWGARSFKQLNELFAGNDMIGYVAKERVDGKLILPEAVQIMKLKGAE